MPEMLRVKMRATSFPHLPDIDLKLLRVFNAIVENGGFSPAQYDLNMSLPAISSAMTHLEGRLGFKLCERGRGGFQLTEGGVVVHRELRKLLASIDAFQDGVHSFKGEMHGQIAIAVDDAIITNFRCPLHKIIRHFVRAAPDLDLAVTIMSPPDMEKALLENRLNIAIGPFREISNALDSRLVYEETQLLCCGTGHPAFGLTDRQQIDDAIADSDYAARSYNDESFNLDDTKFIKSLSTSNMEALLALILTGRFVGYLPRHFCESWVERGEIWALQPEFYSYSVPIVVVHKRNHNDPRVRLFLDSLEEQVR